MCDIVIASLKLYQLKRGKIDMTMKKIALALLATSAMADRDCAPEGAWGSQSNFSVELAGGSSTMMGSPSSDTANPDIPVQQWLNANFRNENTGDAGGSVDIEIDSPAGYQANWNKMTGLPNRMGFAGQLNMHYTAVHGAFAGGVYAGVGYNGAHSSSTIPGAFNNTVYKNYALVPDSENVKFNSISYDKGDNLQYNPSTASALSGRANENANRPAGKATVSSGLMFQAGTRFGAMIGNAFPHMRVGWAAYQLKAVMTNQQSEQEKTAPISAQVSELINVTNNNEVIILNGTIVNVGVTQRFGSVDPFYKLDDSIKIASKGSKWANAITVGAGVDWAFQKMTLGFYYQAAICQKVTFDKWNKDVTAGQTKSTVDLNFGEGTYSAGALTKTGAFATCTYGTKVPKVSMSPVIHTAMVSVKYVINKA